MIRDLLVNVRRSNAPSRVFTSAAIRPLDKNVVQKGFNVIGEQSARLQKNLHWLFLQNKKILEDNRSIVTDMMRLRYENVKNLNELLACTVTAIQSLDNNLSFVNGTNYRGNMDTRKESYSKSSDHISNESACLVLGNKFTEERGILQKIEKWNEKSNTKSEYRKESPLI